MCSMLHTEGTIARLVTTQQLLGKCVASYKYTSNFKVTATSTPIATSIVTWLDKGDYCIVN